MARATQLRLNQITGSLGTSQINDQIAAVATGSIAAENFETILSHLAGAIKRIHGDDSFSESAAGEFHQDLKLNSTSKLQFTDSGMFIHGSADGALHLESDGTDGDAININTSHANGGIDIDAGTSGVDIDTSGDINLTSTKNGASAITLNASTGVNAQIKVTNTQGTNEAAIQLASTAGGVDIDAAANKNVDISGGQVLVTSKDNAASAISLVANVGSSETIVVTNTQGTNLSAIDIDATAGGVNIFAGIDNANSLVLSGSGVKIDGNVSRGINIGTSVSGVPITIGHGTSEVTIGDNLTVTGDTTLTGDLIVLSDTTTVVSSSNMVIQDSIIGLGFSGSDDSGSIFNNVGQRAVIFGRSSNQHDFLPALNYDGTGFVLGTFNASPASGTMGAAQAGTELRAGHLKPVSDDGATLGDANERWSDLFLANGGVIDFNNGNFKLTHSNNALTIDTDDKIQFRDANAFIHSNDANDLLAAATDITLDAGNDIILDAANEKISLKKAGTEVGSIIMDENDGQGLIVSSSLNQSLTLDSNQGFIIMGQSTLDGGSNGAAFVLGGNSIQIETPTYDPGGGHTAFKFIHNDTYGSQHMQISGSLRLYKSNAGDRYVAIDVDNPGSNYTITLPDTVATGNDDILVSDTSGNLSFKSTSTLGIGTSANVTRTNMIVSQAVASGSELNPNSVNISNVAPSARADLNLSSVTNANLPNHVDVYVNGQLLLSGSDANVGAGTADYFVNVHAAASRIKFAFGLEVDDVVSVLRKA